MLKFIVGLMIIIPAFTAFLSLGFEPHFPTMAFFVFCFLGDAILNAAFAEDAH